MCYLIYLFSIKINLEHLIGLLCESRTVLRSPEILLILLTCPLLQENSNIMNSSLPLAIIIAHLNEKTLATLSKQLCILYIYKTLYFKTFLLCLCAKLTKYKNIFHLNYKISHQYNWKKEIMT